MSEILPPHGLSIHLLGPFRVLVNGKPVEGRRWARRKPKLLVKLLALQPHRRMHREQLMEALWPGLDPEAAANSLNKAIHMARHALEPGLKSAADSRFIRTEGQQVVLTAPGGAWVDADEFARLAAAAGARSAPEEYERALALYAGDLLAEDPYEEWAAGRREQLRGLRQELLSRLACAHESRGEFERGAAALRELLALDPSDEDAHRRLMRLYALAGDRRRALRQYRQCVEDLRRELDAEPERATAELYEQIAAGRLHPPPAPAPPAAAREEEVDSLAVLPFTNESADPELEYLSDGIAESIINTLSRLPRLKVMARATVFRFKGAGADPRSAGRELGVRAVLAGRVLLVGDRLVVGAELIDAADGSQLWGERYERGAADIFAVQEAIAGEIAGKLRLRLSGEERSRLTKRHTEDTEAYRLYLKGRHFWNRRTVEGLQKGIECFRQAISLDPGYALAHAGVSDCYAFLGDVGLTAMSSGEAFARAKEAAARSLELDDQLAEAHVSMAHVLMHYFDWPGAEREFVRAIELSPNHAVAHQWYAYYLLFNGRREEAIAECRRALALDPLSLSANGDLGQVLHYARRYDEGIEQYRKALELDPHFYRQHLWLGWAYEQKGMHEEARAAFRRAVSLSEENTEAIASLACADAAAGREDEARRALARLRELSARQYVSPYNMALVCLSLGRKGEALGWLDRAYDERAEWMIYLSVDPRLDRLRGEPRFEELLRRVGFAP